MFPKVRHIKFAFIFSGNTPETRGTAFVVYEDIFDAKNACDHLSGFNVCNRYLVVLYYQVSFAPIWFRLSIIQRNQL
jgi:RNA recognition motif-containing protein